VQLSFTPYFEAVRFTDNMLMSILIVYSSSFAEEAGSCKVLINMLVVFFAEHAGLKGFPDGPDNSSSKPIAQYINITHCFNLVATMSKVLRQSLFCSDGMNAKHPIIDNLTMSKNTF